MNKDSFFRYNESQAKTGYRAAIVYKEASESKYKFLCASETVPFLFGTNESFEYDILNSASKGKVEGKPTLDQKEVELLYTPNNAYLFETLKGEVLDFMALTPDLIGYKFHGTISFRPNDATADIHRGTYTITPMGAEETPIFDARTLCYEPTFFKNVIPYEISTSSGTDTTIDLSIVGPAQDDVSYTYRTYSSSEKKFSGTKVNMTVTANGMATLPTTDGLYLIECTPTDAAFSGCFTLVYLIP